MIFVIIFDRDNFLISDFSARNKHFSLAIYFREESQHSFIFYQFFHRQQSIFQHSHCFFLIIENDRKLSRVCRNFDYFFFESRKFRKHFFLKCASFLLIRINSKDRKAIKNDDSFLWKEREEKATKDEKFCRLLKSTRRESKRFNALDIMRFENLITAAEFFETSERISEIKDTILTIFFSSI